MRSRGRDHKLNKSPDHSRHVDVAERQDKSTNTSPPPHHTANSQPTQRPPRRSGPKPHTLHNLRDTRLLSRILIRVTNPALIHSPLRCQLLLRLVVPLSFLDARVAYGFRSVGCEAAVIEDGAGEGAGSGGVGGFDVYVGSIEVKAG